MSAVKRYTPAVARNPRTDDIDDAADPCPNRGLYARVADRPGRAPGRRPVGEIPANFICAYLCASAIVYFLEPDRLAREAEFFVTEIFPADALGEFVHFSK